MRIVTEELGAPRSLRCSGASSRAAPTETFELPTDERTFLDVLNATLSGLSAPLTAATNLRDELESLELVLVWALMDELGAELPAGFEAAVVTVRDLFDHAQLRWQAEGVL